MDDRVREGADRLSQTGDDRCSKPTMQFHTRSDKTPATFAFDSHCKQAIDD